MFQKKIRFQRNMFSRNAVHGKYVSEKIFFFDKICFRSNMFQKKYGSKEIWFMKNTVPILYVFDKLFFQKIRFKTYIIFHLYTYATSIQNRE